MAFQRRKKRLMDNFFDYLSFHLDFDGFEKLERDF